MKVLYIHTYYKEKGGEDVVFEMEKVKMQQNSITIKSLAFNNFNYTFFKVLFYHFNIFSYFRVIKTIRLFKPDIIHIHNLHFSASPAIIWAASLCKIPMVMTLHNYRLICPSGILYHNGEVFLDSVKGNFPWQAVKKRVYKNSFVLSFWLASSMWLHKKIGTWKKIKEFIILTEFAKNIFLQANIGILEKQITVKSNFIIHSAGTDIVQKSGFVYVGRLSEEKGIDTVIEAYQQSPFNLTIIGDGVLRKKVQVFVKANPQVKYLGFQDNLMVQEILKSTGILLFPSKSFEGMPITIIESLAGGTPVIASALGSI
ncbi:MAG: glycosyltransferase, partial [Sphingobacteriaceae bacterium]